MVIGIKQFAVTYGCGTYGSGSYDTNTVCSTTTNSGSNSGGALPETGQSIIYGLVGGIILIAIAIALFVSSRRNKRK